MIKELFILPFDHRTSFIKDILNVNKKISKSQEQQIKELKRIIFEGFLEAIKKQEDKKPFAVLVDEQFGKEIIKEAQDKNIKICLPVEKSGQEDLQMEYGSLWKKHVMSIRPDFVKVLIRYNPLNVKRNTGQLKKLSEIDEFCRKNGFKVILELLVPPAKEDLDCADYDTNKRSLRTMQAIREIKEKIKVYIWKMEGFSNSQWKKIIPLIGKESKIIFLGRGQDRGKVEKWLIDASKHKEIIGFAIGRTIFLETLKEYHQKIISKEEAVRNISNNFLYYITLWRKNKKEA